MGGPIADPLGQAISHRSCRAPGMTARIAGAMPFGIGHSRPGCGGRHRSDIQVMSVAAQLLAVAMKPSEHREHVIFVGGSPIAREPPYP